jgi:hypothetical protein
MEKPYTDKEIIQGFLLPPPNGRLVAAPSHASASGGTILNLPCGFAILNVLLNKFTFPPTGACINPGDQIAEVDKLLSRISAVEPFTG